MESAIGDLARRYPNLMAEPTEDYQNQHRAFHRAEMARRESRYQSSWSDAVEGLGERYRGCRLNNYEVNSANRAAHAAVTAYCENIREHVQDGSCLVFYGPSGTGKDHLMVAALHEACLAGLHVRWINGLDWFGDNRDAIDRGDTEKAAIERLARPAVLAISDPKPPFGKLSDYQASMLFRLVDRRYRERRPTWITINVAKGIEAASTIGSAVYDRLSDRCVAVPCFWESYRKPISKKEQL